MAWARPSGSAGISSTYKEIEPPDILVVTSGLTTTSANMGLLSRENVLLTLKICIAGRSARRQLDISNHIKSIEEYHPGKERVRVVLDNFRIEGPFGSHDCLLFRPPGLDLFAFHRSYQENMFQFCNATLLGETLVRILLGLDFLHLVGIVHTGLFRLSDRYPFELRDR